MKLDPIFVLDRNTSDRQRRKMYGKGFALFNRFKRRERDRDIYMEADREREREKAKGQ